MVRIIATVLVVVSAYFYGFHQGQNKEELKSARAQITTLKRTIETYKTKQTNDALALSELRLAESASRDELDRMRSQLADIERVSKTDTDRERNRCLSLAVRYKEAVDRADRAIKFCAENHK
jgi:Tfp pilus assembly protein PilO